MRTRRSARPSAGHRVVAGVVTTLVAVTGCSGGAGSAPKAGPADSATSARPSGPAVLQPGGPGEAASTLGPDARLPASEWNQADVGFMQMMVPHHAQALDMSELARARTGNASVRALARRISAAQGPEIIEMSSWLEARGLAVAAAHGGMHGSGHAAMMGMLTEAEMKTLAAAQGKRFDLLFLRGMIGHHQGAVAMADQVATAGTDVRVSEVAADIGVGQSAEIQRMRALLDRL